MDPSSRTEYYMAGSISASTAKSYDRAFKTWAQFSSANNLPLFPADPVALGNCLSEVADSSGSFSALSTIVASVARYHWDRFLPSPTENFSFRRLLQGFRRRLSKPPTKKDPLTPEILASAIHLVRTSGKLQEWRTVARMCFAFYAGCRWSDSISLKVSHLQFDSDGVSVTIPKSKTDQLGRGETVYIQFATHPSCPVTLIQDYIDRLHYEPNQDGFLQPRITSNNGIQRGIWNTTVSYSTALSDLRLLLTSLGYDSSRFGEHSGRRGGATTASDAGVDWTDLMSHGRWKSVATPLGYLANSRHRQRRVAQALAFSTSASSSDDSVAIESESSSNIDSIPASNPVASASSRFSFRPLETLAAYRAAAEAAASLPPTHPPYLPVPVRNDPQSSAVDTAAVSSDSFALSPHTLDSLFKEDETFEIVIYD